MNEPSERLLAFARRIGLATGHADTEQALLDELEWQIRELQDRYRALRMRDAAR